MCGGRRFAVSQNKEEAMKKILILMVMLIAALGIHAQKPESLTIKNGGQTVSKTGRITIKFLEMVEDSRCPADVNCVWAGVATIKIRLTRSGKSSEIELNTTNKATTSFQGYSVALTELEPRQSTTSKYSPSAYSARFTVSRAKR